MRRRTQLILDGSAIRSEADLHRELADLLGFFDGYGANLDALWDVLEDDDLRQTKGPVEILWRDAGTFGAAHPDYFRKLQRLFAESDQPVSLLVAL